MFRLIPAYTLAGVLTICVGQETVHLASLAGRVTDASGGVLCGAQVKARHRASNITLSADTDREGRYRFPYLRTGEYDIGVHTNGFAEAIRSATLTAGSALELPFTLIVGPAETT